MARKLKKATIFREKDCGVQLFLVFVFFRGR